MDALQCSVKVVVFLVDISLMIRVIGGLFQEGMALYLEFTTSSIEI